MNSTQQKTPVIAGRGHLLNLVRATGKRPHAPVALRSTAKRHFEVNRYEIIIR